MRVGRVHPALAIALGAMSALLAFAPWLATDGFTGLVLHKANLPSAQTWPDEPSRSLFIIGHFAFAQMFATIVFAAALAGVSAALVRRSGREMRAEFVLLGALTVQIAWLARELAVSDFSGLSTTQPGAYAPVLVNIAIVAILLGIPIMLGIARGNPAPRTVAIAAAAVTAGPWLAALVLAMAGTAQPSLTLWRVLDAIPPIIVGLAIGWCGFRTVKRTLASIASLAIICLVPALMTALAYALAFGIGSGTMSAALTISRAVFPQALGFAGWGPQRVAITVVAATLSWFVLRARGRDSDPSESQPEPQPALASNA